jgi:hypothetical protein
MNNDVVSINFFCKHVSKCKYVNDHWPQPSINYINPPVLEWEGVSVFSDEQCFTDLPIKVKSKYKVAWALESPVVRPQIYNNRMELIDIFDKIYICNPEYYRNHPKIEKLEFGACFIWESHCRVYPKNKLLSIVASKKKYASGHKLRHEIINDKLHPELELWGSGYRPYDEEPDSTVLPFKDYMYTIAIENCVYPGYFTDKIIDCFATGCIPIYQGCPLMDQRFDKRGFYTFNTISELKDILDKISPEDYYSKLEYVKENYKSFKKYASPDLNLVNVLKKDGFL